ncbi:MAG TPA: class I SAM-dependent methyltransferase [Deltaproteobacteria bacterium]|nr:class I SAM-dependent methyltransferase [Deltaproteobacteria bacterium]HOM29574.1 class I SAM-dependent methyltransferase [Deltaproteobacteria bacterium]HPP81841.1 class I SAM-dependent methyltransferase [Deltaproteobacteria bacterium]
MTQYQGSEKQVASGDRFAFGANWSRFLKTLNDDRILQAETSLKEMLETQDLTGRSFLDIGSGSGLSSLAARRLGARVHSFDYDPQSVACTKELKRRYFPDDELWRIELGSILDDRYVSSLGKWDIVYSWGVLHHTGDLWKAMEHAVSLVDKGGSVFIAIYNDQGYLSSRWARLKYLYNKKPWTRPILLAYGLVHFWGRTFLKEFIALRPFETWKAHYKNRGMSAWHDLVDWMGGWPYEVATPDAVFHFCRDRGFTLRRLVTRQGIGNNEFVFVRNA